jgi:hypothetical protein
MGDVKRIMLSRRALALARRDLGCWRRPGRAAEQHAVVRAESTGGSGGRSGAGSSGHGPDKTCAAARDQMIAGHERVTRLWHIHNVPRPWNWDTPRGHRGPCY